MRLLHRYLSSSGIALALLTSGLAASAQAQTLPTLPKPSPGFFDPAIQFGQDLAKKGIYLNTGVVADITGVANGGAQTGVMPIEHFYIGAIFDMETIAGIPEGSFHIQFDQRAGLSVNEIAGSPSGLLQSDAGPFRPRLGQFFWEQGFFKDRIDVTFGRTNPTSDFAFSDISCNFVGVICAQPTSWYFSNLNTAYPSATWGGRVNFAVTPEVYARAGVYQHSVQQGLFNNAGFNWGVNSPGVFVPVEVGYQTTFTNAAYPAKYNVGFYEDSASYTNLEGQRGGRNAVWAQFQQAVWRPDRSTQQSLTVFGGGIIYSGHTPNWAQYYLGLYDRSPFLSRPRDTVGLIGSVFINNSASRPNKSTQETFELNYGYSVIPGVTVKPYTQYVINPTNGGGTGREPSNAWVVGLQLAFSPTQALQFPEFIPH